MNNISIANETIRITKERKYTLGSREILLPDLNFEKVIVISPDKGEKIIDHGCLKYKKESMCRIEILNSDSFQAGRNYDNPLVMNFANAHHPGGGFLLGANAQEESLCRCSTLYASLTSKRASEMYRYNNTHPSKVESDYMLLSPDVAVFRNENYNLLDSVSVMGVITVPAPNRHGAAFFASKELIKETFIRRIRILLLVASKYGYKNLVLGACLIILMYCISFQKFHRAEWSDHFFLINATPIRKFSHSNITISILLLTVKLCIHCYLFVLPHRTDLSG